MLKIILPKIQMKEGKNMSDNYVVTLGEVLRLFRLTQDGWTIKMAAQKLEISPKQLSRIEKNSKKIYKDTQLLKKFAMVYGVPIGEFFKIERKLRKCGFDFQQALEEVLKTYLKHKAIMESQI